jgi:D-arabinose 1-dehydrogenase-like Zn-dependent alcohol dehydrogenase
MSHLWMEKKIKTVANVTHADNTEFLPIAAQIPMRPVVETYPLEEANRDAGRPLSAIMRQQYWPVTSVSS